MAVSRCKVFTILWGFPKELVSVLSGEIGGEISDCPSGLWRVAHFLRSWGHALLGSVLDGSTLVWAFGVGSFHIPQGPEPSSEFTSL